MSNFLVRSNQDSPLKKAVEYTAVAFLGYFGSKLLFAQLKSDQATHNADKVEEQAIKTPVSAQGVANRLFHALNDSFDTNEVEVFNVLGRDGKRNGAIQTKEYLDEVAAQYAIRSKGINLYTDLRKISPVGTHDFPWSDYQKVLVQIQLIRANPRKK